MYSLLDHPQSHVTIRACTISGDDDGVKNTTSSRAFSGDVRVGL